MIWPGLNHHWIFRSVLAHLGDIRQGVNCGDGHSHCSVGEAWGALTISLGPDNA